MGKHLIAFAKGFVALNWYDGLIEFVFKFVAMTSEPLLAAGIAYSAAVYLSSNHIGGSANIQDMWAWTQAIAVESSTGIVLMYGLLSLKERDTIKAKLYLVLSVLLAVTGGIMLFLKMAHMDGQDGNMWMYALFGLRCIVSVGYIGLCRTKRIRFSGFMSETVETPVSISDETMQQILSRLAKLDELERTVGQVSISMETARQAAIPERTTVDDETSVSPETPAPVDSRQTRVSKKGKTSRRRQASSHPETPNKRDSTHDEQRVRELMRQEPGLSINAVSTRLDIPRSTVGKLVKEVREEGV